MPPHLSLRTAAFPVTPSSRNVPASVKSGQAPVWGAARLLLMQPAMLCSSQNDQKTWEENKEAFPQPGSATEIYLVPGEDFFGGSLRTVTFDSRQPLTGQMCPQLLLHAKSPAFLGSLYQPPSHCASVSCTGLVLTFSGLKSSVAPTALRHSCINSSNCGSEVQPKLSAARSVP